MKRALDIIAQALSIILYPLFVPTYGMALFCYGHHTQVSPFDSVWMIVAIAGTFVLTCAIPLSIILYMIFRGHVRDIYIRDARERTSPYQYTTIAFGFWCILLIAVLKVPIYISVVGVGATLAIGIVTLINRYWKISAHLTAMGGLFGGFMSYCLGIGAIPMWTTYIVWLGLILLLMYARLWLNAHTPGQVICGLLLGLAFTLIPNLIIYYGT